MTPRTAKQNRAIQEESKRTIIEAALRLFATHGYDSTSIRMLAEEAGVSQGLLYNYFDGKQGLLVEIMSQGMKNASKAFEHVPHDAPPLEQLAALIRGIATELEKDSQFWRVFYSLRNLPAFEQILGEEIIKANQDLKNFFQDLYARADVDDAELRAYSLYAMVEGIIQQYLLLGEDYPLQAVVERTVKLFCSIEN